MSNDDIRRFAIAESPFRYWLEQIVDGGSVMDSCMMFCLLNPSVADAERDDPTARRMRAFARREGFRRWGVVNLFALVSTEPTGLLAPVDAVGPRNDEMLAQAVTEAMFGGTLVVGWGALTGRLAALASSRIRALRNVAIDLPVRCLGTTRDGSPRHPLYVRADQPLVEWRTG